MKPSPKEKRKIVPEGPSLPLPACCSLPRSRQIGHPGIFYFPCPVLAREFPISLSEYVHTLSGGQLIRETPAKRGLATGFCGPKPSGAKTYQNVLSATKYAVGRNGLLARMGCRQASGGACREVACRAGARAPLPARAVHGRRRGASSRHGTGCCERQRS